MNPTRRSSRSRFAIKSQIHNNRTIIEYPTITNEEVVIKKSQILTLYNQYLKTKENMHFINYESPEKPPKKINVMVQELNVHTRLQNKNLILKTQMRKYKNMSLYDQKRLLNVKPQLNSRERIQKLKAPNNHFSLEPTVKVENVNSYGRILLKLAYQQQKPTEVFYYSKQTSPIESLQSSINFQPYASRQNSPSMQPRIRIPTQQQQLPRIINPKFALRGWDTHSHSSRSNSR